MSITLSDLQTLKDYNAKSKPDLALMNAAVAIVLRETQAGFEVLLMQRAQHPDDPWSGQMAFPGGKIESSDDSALEAAMREFQEECGFELAHGDYLGQLDDIFGLRVDDKYSVRVSCFLFFPSKHIELSSNYEVADLVWLPFSFLENADNRHEYPIPSNPQRVMPAVLIDSNKGQVLWGLSLRMLMNFYDVLGRELSVLHPDQQAQLRASENHNIQSKKLDSVTRKIFDKTMNRH